MAILATDDEALATELWGDNKEWDDERKQFVPVEKEVARSAGNSTEPFESSTEKKSDEKPKNRPPTAPTTVPTSKSAPVVSSTVDSTGGSGVVAKPAPPTKSES